jgi:hypothetical protein
MKGLASDAIAIHHAWLQRTEIREPCVFVTVQRVGWQ